LQSIQYDPAATEVLGDESTLDALTGAEESLKERREAGEGGDRYDRGKCADDLLPQQPFRLVDDIQPERRHAILGMRVAIIERHQSLHSLADPNSTSKNQPI